mgnify:CR=1 FL=1
MELENNIVDKLSCKYINNTFLAVGWYLTINGGITADEPLALALGIKPSKFKEMIKNFTYQTVYLCETFKISISIFETKEKADALILALKLMEKSNI